MMICLPWEGVFLLPLVEEPAGLLNPGLLAILLGFSRRRKAS
jgi:hypothetical protein